MSAEPICHRWQGRTECAQAVSLGNATSDNVLVPSDEARRADVAPREVVFGIVVVTHNHSDDVARCLAALQQFTGESRFAIVVRDCGSDDDSAEVAERHPLSCTVIRGNNIGFGPACNEGAAAMPPDVTHLMFLNPDTEVLFPLEELAEAIRAHPVLLHKFGCVGLRQVDLQDRLVWAWDNFPSVGLEWRKAWGRPLLQRSEAGYTGDREVDWVMGSLLLIPREVFEDYRGFDPRYFLFYEEIDLCRRLRAGGLQVLYLNGFTYRHRQNGKATLWREVLRLNSRRVYDRRWLSRSQTLGCQCAQTVRWIRTLVIPRLRAERKYAFARLMATWGFLRAETVQPYDVRMTPHR